MTACQHCGAAVSDNEQFCCPGCEVAHTALDILSTNSQFSAFATLTEDGHHTLTLAVGGLHCARCIQLIENTLYGDPRVTEARVNMSTERVTFTWLGSPQGADELAKSISDLGYSLKAFDDTSALRPANTEERQLLKAMAVAGFAAGNLMMISVGLWASTAETMGFATRGLFHWISVLIAMPAILYAGQPFFRSAISVLRARRTNMDVPISLAVLLTSAMSLHEAITYGEHLYFDSAVMLLFFLLIGRYLDSRAKGQARQSAQNLLAKLSGQATVLDGDKARTLPIRDLRPGMVVLVGVGENIPADGKVKKGASELDVSLMTGETLPQAVGAEDTVFAGTTNLLSPLHLTITKASENSLLNDIIKLMETAEQSQSHYVRLADKAARLYTPVVHTLGLLTFLGWWGVMGQPWQLSLLIAVTVLIITCPCALGLAVPVVQVLASSLLMKRGVLLKSGNALERLSGVTTVVFDKTGTLTLGHPELLPGGDNQNHLPLAASLARHSRHPLSQAIVQEFEGESCDVNDVQEIPGHGLEGTYQNQTVRLGKRSWCGGANSTCDDEQALELCLSVDDKPLATFRFADRLRPDAKQVVDSLHAMGLKTLLLSGDRNSVVQHTADAVGMDDARADLTPPQKHAIIQNLQAQGGRVLMVGDGLNDAPSLAVADVSLSPSTAIDITQNSADLVFQGEALMPVLNAIKTAKRAQTLVKQNFALAVIYNIIAIPVAVMGFITPLIAALAMSGSSLVVIANSFRLKRGHTIS